MKLSEMTPTRRLLICKADLNEAREQNKKMHEALKSIVNAQYEKGGTLAGLNGTVSNARDLLKEIDNGNN